MNGAETVKRNLENARKLERAGEVIVSAQLLEAARCLTGASPTAACEYFQRAFEKGPVCPEMFSLSRLICKGHGKKHEEKKDTVMVSCIKNPISLAAARKMCADATTLRVVEETDFRSACEAVASKQTDYCILPMCSSSDGYYPTFSKLCKANDLKICSTVRISKSDSDEELQLALLSRELEIPSRPEYACFSFVCDEQSLLWSLVCALGKSGCIPTSITSAPLEYNMDRFEHRIEVRLWENNAEALLYFLEATLPGHTVLGVYQ